MAGISAIYPGDAYAKKDQMVSSHPRAEDYWKS